MASKLLRIHSSFHKCLTMYYMSVMETLYNNKYYSRKRRYEHFESIEGLVYNRAHRYKIISTNGFAIDPDRLSSDYRITRFVRDPRDLIISGYFYHLRGAEPWFRMKNPTANYWSAINGNVPAGMPKNTSYSEYLQSLSQEDGLLAEIEFRKHQLASLREWQGNPKIKLFKYEDIIGNEVQTFKQIFDFMELSSTEKTIGSFLAKRYSSEKKLANKKHIRNASPGQWQEYFSDNITNIFNNQYGDILEKYEYQ